MFLVQLPPPIHGASAVNKSIQESKLINNQYSTHFINISPASDLSDIGKYSLVKILKIIRIFFGIIVSFHKFKPDLIYITLSPHGLAFYKDGLIALILKTMGGRLVFHLHGKGIKKEADKSWFKKNIYKLVFRKVDVIHLSEKLFSDLEGIRDPSTSIVAVANGIDNSDYTDSQPRNTVLTFIYLSNLIRTKGADILIRASALISEKYNQRFQVRIIGNPSTIAYANELKNLITPRLSEIIKIVGPKYGKEKALELCTSHIFVLPTKNDCFPLSILEAMAAGLVVISTNEGAISDIVDHGVTGEILPIASPEALAEAMIKHIENQQYSQTCSQSGHEKFLSKYTQAIFEKNLAAALKCITERTSSL